MFRKNTIDEFTKTLASDTPVPGGGSASALAGSTAVSLVSMVAALTQGKKGYEEHWDEMKAIQEKMEEFRQYFLEAMDRDAGSYEKVMNCYKMPRNSDKEKEERAQAIQDALYGAALVPLEIARKGSEIFAYAKDVIIRGNKNASSDGAVAALMARASVKGALHNVEINAASIKDMIKKRGLMDELKSLASLVDKLEKEVVELIEF